MSPEDLYTAIQTDPQAKAMADAGDDAGCAARLSSILPTSTRLGSFVTERTLFDAYGDPADAQAVIATLDAVATSQSPLAPVIATVRQWLKPSEGGIDLGNPKTRDQIDAIALAVPTGFTPARVATLKAIGEAATQVTSGDVSRAYLSRRPGGRINP